MFTYQMFTKNGLVVEGPNGEITVNSIQDVIKAFEDFNEELNTVLSQREDLREQLSKASGEIASLNLKLKTAYKEGYQAAQMDKAEWNLD